VQRIVEKAVEHAIDAIKELGIDAKPEYIKVQNIVASADLGSELNLNAIALAFLEDVEYESEQFPGLFYKLRDPKAVILVFNSGRIVIVGCKTTKDVEKAVENFCNKLENFGFL